MDPNSLDRNIFNTFGASMLEAFGSASIWSLLWLFIFMVTNGIAEAYLSDGDTVSEISAAALTVAVIANSTPKIISYFLNGDTDLRGIFKRIELRRVKWNRLVICLSIISFAVYILTKDIANGVDQFQVYSISFFTETVYWWSLVLLLYSNQVIFSWPDAAQLGAD